MTGIQIASQNFEAALGYARRGWHVLPVGAGPDCKLPYIKNWTRDASVDEAQIASWWLQFPDANIGIATGPKSGFWVVDVDMKNSVDGLNSLMARFGDEIEFDFKRYLAGKTATGGIHFLFQWDPASPVRNGQSVLPGVDIRGDGGQIVVAPSSRLINGEWVKYRWNDENLPIAEAPHWALDLLKHQKDQRATGVDVRCAISGLSEGERDTELFRFACLLSHHGVPYDMAEAFLSVAAERCNPPFSQAVAIEKVERAYRYPRTATKGTLKRHLLELVRGCAK